MRGIWNMPNGRAVHWRKAKRALSRGVSTAPFSKGGGITCIHVWNEHQRTPARLYGERVFGKGRFRIIVSDNPHLTRLKQGGIFYNFA